MTPTATPDPEPMPSDFAIRSFVPGRDEAVWVDIHNRAWQEDKDFAPETVEELKRWDDAPWVGVRTRLMAKLGGVPVATVNAETDNTRADNKGFLRGPDVAPEHRRRGIGTELAVRALASLHGAGMRTAEVVGFDNPSVNGFLESLGFAPVRRFCWMRRTLAAVPSEVGEAHEVEVLPLGRTDDELALLCRLSNEAFKEHYNHTPSTADEWKFAAKKHQESGIVTYHTLTRVAGEPVGFLMYAIDPKENEHLRRKRGWLWSIGVLKQYRGRGIAKRLMIDAMNHLRREGMEEAQLAVDETNVTNAMKLYERLGFTVARRRLVWNKNLAGFDAPAPST